MLVGSRLGAWRGGAKGEMYVESFGQEYCICPVVGKWASDSSQLWEIYIDAIITGENIPSNKEVQFPLGNSLGGGFFARSDTHTFWPSTYSVKNGDRHLYLFRNKRGELRKGYVDGGHEGFASEVFYSNKYPMYFFKDGGTAHYNNYCKMKLFRCWIELDGEIIYDFVPFEKDGEAGVYEKINGVLCPNLGGGELKIGYYKVGTEVTWGGV